ncbi:TPA: flagellin FliC, partial [Candidatus Galligastranaerophilus faecipullorum]|nr:flagellin FliC [Candidatus Galligastranaerophilus faecipullorum]
QEEAQARLAEIDRIATGAKFNTFDLFGGATHDSADETVTLQIGTGSEGSTNTIEISDVFNDAHVSTLTGQAAFASSFVGTDLAEMQAQLDQLDTAITEISSRRGTIGSVSNRLDSVIEQLDTQYENLSAANSRITDADIATESSNYIKNQILQQASASLLTQANQQPNIALSLI